MLLFDDDEGVQISQQSLLQIYVGSSSCCCITPIAQLSDGFSDEVIEV